MLHPKYSSACAQLMALRPSESFEFTTHDVRQVIEQRAMTCMFEVKDVFQLVINSYNDTAFTQEQQRLLGDEPLGPAKELFCPYEKERRRLHRFIGAH